MQVQAVWPQIDPVLRPHAVPRVLEPATPRPHDDIIIAVLGNIGPHKGAAIVEGMARHLGQNPSASLVVIGNIDPSFVLPRGTQVHGTYDPADLPNLIARYHITHWVIPSIWPETISYTTHEALATGLPVVTFDLGGQAEAVRAAQNGRTVAFRSEGDMAKVMLDAILSEH